MKVRLKHIVAFFNRNKIKPKFTNGKLTAIKVADGGRSVSISLKYISEEGKEFLRFQFERTGDN